MVRYYLGFSSNIEMTDCLKILSYNPKTIIWKT